MVKMLLVMQNSCVFGKLVVFNLGKMVVFRKSGLYLTKFAVFGQMGWICPEGFYLAQMDCIW